MGIEAGGTFHVGGDLRVHRMGFGAMRLCGHGVWGFPDDPENTRRVLARTLELGVDFFDTADAYGPEVNEYQLAAHLIPYKGLTIATKGGLTRGGPGEWFADGRPEYLTRRIENSLRRLRVDCIDLYQLHTPDQAVPFLDSIGALARAREAGKIRHIGLSNVSVDQLKRARRVAPIATVQNRYNLTYRTHQDVLDACESYGIGFIPWFPLAAGALSASAAGMLHGIADRHGATTSQISLAWLLQKSPVMLPIPGTSKVAHLEENVGATDITLTADEMRQLDAMAS